MSERVKGKVKWFNTTKGFGSISPDDGSEDLFVHQSAIKSDGFRSLNEGDSVEFVVGSGNDGRTRAVDVTGPGGAQLTGGFRPGGGDRGRGCYKCGEEGHMARECSQGVGGGGGYGEGGYRSGGGGGGRGCYSCGEEGHMARECPNKNY